VEINPRRLEAGGLPAAFLSRNTTQMARKVFSTPQASSDFERENTETDRFPAAFYLRRSRFERRLLFGRTIARLRSGSWLLS